MAEQETDGSSSGAGACPICGKPTVRQFRPFCSKRCTHVDLHRWLSGRYAIPVKDDEDEDGTLPEGSAPLAMDDPEKD